MLDQSVEQTTRGGGGGVGAAEAEGVENRDGEGEDC